MTAANKKTITIQLKKSVAGRLPAQRATLRGLGLKKIGDKKILENQPAVRGMIKKVMHLVEIVVEK